MNPTQEAAVKAWWFDRMSALANENMQLAAMVAQRDAEIAELKKAKAPESGPSP